MKKNNKFSMIFLYVLSFLIIYTPTIFSNLYINYILPFIYFIIAFLFLKRKKKNFKYSKIYKSLFTLILIWIFAAIFFAIRALISSNTLLEFKDLRIVQSFSIICTILNITLIEQHLTYLGYDIRKKIQFLINIVMIQFVFVFLMMIFPNFRLMVLNHFYLNGEWNPFTVEKRVYGIMQNYTYSAPIFHGIVATIVLTCSIVYSKKYLIYLPFILITIILNGRTGLLVFFLGIVLNFTYFILNKKYVFKVISTSIIIFIILSLSLVIIKNFNFKTYNFLIGGIEDVYNYLTKGEKDGNVEVLLEDFEEKFNYEVLLFGKGYTTKSKLGNSQVRLTDMGYLNDMYMGGIIYMLLLYIPIIRFILKDYDIDSLSEFEKRINSMIKVFLILTLFICNIKGDVFRSSILILITIFLKLIIFDKEEISNEK